MLSGQFGVGLRAFVNTVRYSAETTSTRRRHFRAINYELPFGNVRFEPKIVYKILLL